MSNPKVWFGIIAIGVCLILAIFAIWQDWAKRNLSREKLNPRDYAAFKDFPYSKWYVGVKEFSLFKLFSHAYDRMGKVKIFDQNHLSVGHIGVFNKYQTRSVANGRSISSTYELQNFTNFIQKIEFVDDSTGGLILCLNPMSKVQIVNIDHQFTFGNKSYRLRSLPLSKALDYQCDIYLGSELVGRLARSSIRQFPMAVTTQEIDPLVLTFSFDLFLRHVS